MLCFIVMYTTQYINYNTVYKCISVGIWPHFAVRTEFLIAPRSEMAFKPWKVNKDRNHSDVKECVKGEGECAWKDYNRNMDFLLVRAATDHNIDNTTTMMHEWISKVENLYHSVYLKTMEKEIRCLYQQMHPKPIHSLYTFNCILLSQLCKTTLL